MGAKKTIKAVIQLKRACFKVAIFICIALFIMLLLEYNGFQAIAQVNRVVNLIIETSNMLSIAMIGFLFTAFSIILSIMPNPKMDRFMKSDGYENLIYVFKSGFVTSALVFLIYLLRDIIFLIPFSFTYFIILFAFLVNAYTVFNCIRVMFAIMSYHRSDDWSSM